MTSKEYQTIYANPPKPKAKLSHSESDLHLAFAKWVHTKYPNDTFVRHEREQKRTGFMSNLFSIFNKGVDKLPDFEGLITNQKYSGFYIEFKKPGRPYCTKDGKQPYSDCVAQYKAHQHLKTLGRAVWFSNDLEHAKSLYIAFKEDRTLPMQEYLIPVSKEVIASEAFLERMGL